MIPITIYRIQFHKNFTFKHLQRILPFLHQLGIATIYASPIFEAVPGSVHGYDCINPLKINPEVGTEEELRELSSRLKEFNMLWVQDIVPNHMAFHWRNPWLMDVLEKGQHSRYSTFFDIDWNNDATGGKLMVPFLGASLDEVIEKGELTIVQQDGRYFLKYFDSHYPLNADTSAVVARKKPEVINASKKILLDLAKKQHYHLCHWQETDTQINYRRFFTVNGLICLNIHIPEVMEHHHQLVKRFVDEGIFDGLRVDHIDGLYDPTRYLHDLKKLAGDDSFIVVEKILEPGESLPDRWPVEGNTGYDFLSLVNNVLTDKDSERTFTAFYQQLAHEKSSVHQKIHDKKAFILFEHMGGELENLYQYFLQLNLVEKKQLAAIHPDDMRGAIAEFLIQCPVYRFYGTSFPLGSDERHAVQEIFRRMRSNSDTIHAVDLLEKVFLEYPENSSIDYGERVAQFYRRCMQFTGPLMAKGVEDTLMYTYNRFIGHNEVGDSPEAFGMTISEFHRSMRDKQQQWPLSMNATSTHDTKRGEDVRARLNVLTDLPKQWLDAVNEWRAKNASLKKGSAPDANDEYLIYQAMVGSYWPGDDESFLQRLQQYLEKALREAKIHSNWTSPNADYESAVKEFAAALMDKDNPFWDSFISFYDSISDHGLLNSLVQVILKFTCPGTPDVYQGCELWDFSFVDPDNRRSVDFDKRMQMLTELTGSDTADLAKMWEQRETGKVKLWLVHTLAKARNENPQVFNEGDYIPLHVEGEFKDHVLSFARKQGASLLVVAVALRTARLCEQQGCNALSLNWSDTRIILPKDIESDILDVVSGMEYKVAKSLRVKDLFAQMPFAIMSTRQSVAERGAGILLHLTSLPSPFGIGDMGPEARAFADFLKRGHQKYWQLLPVNPTDGGQGYSPYSATSSRAGYPLLISPELLVKDGLLMQADIQPYFLPNESRADFAKAAEIKMELLTRACSNYFKTDSTAEFEQFCSQEEEWLNDFALYTILKATHAGMPWYDWPDEYKLRESDALKKLSTANAAQLRQIKWQQYIFFQQWRELKSYCNARGIQLIGDLPFYVSYDSADVWANREIFAIDENGQRTGLAGVPPDAFSSDGQLWGMPVFKWDFLQKQDYKWWVERVRKNHQMFDRVRIDHFRAFAAYWEVPAGADTAKNGEWKPGPGADFFQSIERQLGELPFVAEDLGDVDETVFSLRDQFALPGMKVLHFAFGDDMPASYYIPHNHTENFLVYTGTHDNNTTRGWFREADEKMKQRLEQYAGRPVSDNDVHIILSRMAYASVAKIAILPMQDVLGLDESGRMNTPSSTESNWAWRLVPGQVNAGVERMLQEWTWVFNRK